MIRNRPRTEPRSRGRLVRACAAPRSGAARLSAGLAAGLAAGLLSSCGGGTPYLPQEDVEQIINDKLTKQVGQSPDDITCPRDLEGTVGTTMRCTLTAGPDKLGVTVTVTSVEDKRINFDAEVDSLEE